MSTPPRHPAPEPPSAERLSALISRYLDGACTERELGELRAAFAGDERALELYADLCEIHALLSWELASAGATNVAIPERLHAAPPSLRLRTERSPSRRARMTFPPRRLAAAAAVLLIAAIGASLVVVGPWRSRPRPELLVAHAEGARWVGPGPGPLDELRPGTTYDLHAGTAAVRTASGAHAVIRGPARFGFEDATTLNLQRGTLTAYAPTAEADEFVVVTPAARVRDLGTAFYVSADADATDVFVREGVVEVASLWSDEAGAPLLRSLSAGEGVSVDASGNATPLPSLDVVRGAQWPDVFTGDDARWIGAAARHLADPALLLWLDVDGDRIVNRAIPAAPVAAVHVTTADPPLTRGRVAGSGALDFTRRGGWIGADIPGRHESITVLSWVRLDADAIPEGYEHRVMLASRAWGETGAPHWQVKSRDFRLTFAHPDVTPHAVYEATRSDLFGGEWTMLAVVYDAASNAVTHYWNGRVVARAPIDGSAVPLGFGPSDIGATVATTAQPRSVPMGGALDDLMVWSRPLSPGELRDLYDAGAPDRPTR